MSSYPPELAMEEESSTEENRAHEAQTTNGRRGRMKNPNYVPVKMRRKIFSLVKACLGIIVQAMVLIPSIPIGVAIAVVVIVDTLSILADFYQVKNGTRNFNLAMFEKTCNFQVMLNTTSYIVSMALSIAAIVTGLDSLQLAAVAFSLFVRMVLFEWMEKKNVGSGSD